MKAFFRYDILIPLSILLFTVGYFFIEPTKSFETPFKFILIFLNLLTLILSFFFAKSKAFVLLLLPLFFYFYLYYPSSLGLDGGKISFWYTYPMALSLGFFIISFLSERAILSFYGYTKIALITSLIIFSYFFLQEFSLPTREALELPLFGLKNTFFQLPETILVICFFATVFIALATFLVYKTDIDKSLFYAFTSFLLPSLFFQDNLSFLLFSIAGELLIAGTILKESYKMSYIDTLTSIPSRRALEHEFLKLSSGYSIAMVDIDHFKKFNDTYGHDVGDEVLKLIATQISKVKGGGKAFRYGGEEFTILFKHKSSDKAYMFLEEVREAIANRGFVLRDKDRDEENIPKSKPKKETKNKTVNLSVSIGLASASKAEKSPFDVIKRADNALYEAKENGRNCVVKENLS